jgi:hypothetical protein
MNQVPTPKKIDHDFLLRSVTDHIKIAVATWEAENRPYAIPEETRAAIHKKVVKAWFRQVEQGLEQIKSRFADLLVEDNGKWPRAWMIKDSQIRARLRIDIMYPEACTWARIMNFLWRKSASLAESQRLAKLLPEDMRSMVVDVKGKKLSEDDLRKIEELGQDDMVRLPRSEERPYALLTADCGEMAAETGISRGLCQKYLRAFADAGFIEETKVRTGRPRDGGRKIYAIGTWAGHGSFTHRNAFLKDDEENRARLRRFTLGSLKK